MFNNTGSYMFIRKCILAEEIHAPRQPVKELLSALHDSFGANLGGAIDVPNTPLLDSIDLNSRIISEFKTALLSGNRGDAHKAGCAEILDEVFSDFAIAMYLNSIGLIVPARMSARRAFELGLSAVYMWDMPHEYWGWRKRDQDLSFSAMVAHLNSSGYLEYMTQLKGLSANACFCDQTNFQALYRILSNTVHGKIADIPALAPERFSTITNGLAEHLELIIKTQNAVICLLFGRFSELEAAIHSKLPQIQRP